MSSTCSREDLLPWAWALPAADPLAQTCPTSTAVLGTVVVTDIITILFCIFVGNQAFVNRLTPWLRLPFQLVGLSRFADRLFIDPESSRLDTSFKRSWIWTVAVQFTANAVVAKTTLDAIGNGQTAPSVGDFMMFLFMRPRMNWVVLSLNYRQEMIPFWSNGSWPGNWAKGVYQHLIAEAVIQLVGGTYYAGRTAHFAASRGYYVADALEGCPFRTDAKMMYAGALVYLVFLLPIIFVAKGLLSQSGAEEDRRASDRLLKNHLLSLVGWIGSWLFFAGYVRLAGDLYCPPDPVLASQAGIWVCFSTIAMFGGVAMGWENRPSLGQFQGSPPTLPPENSEQDDRTAAENRPLPV